MTCRLEHLQYRSLLAGHESPADFDAKSFKTAIIRDPSGTLLLVEESNNQNVAGNIWPCVSIGVESIRLRHLAKPDWNLRDMAG
jgi:hypothetical protein